MFKHLHRQNWFPFVVVGLTLTLILFVAWSFVARQNNPAAVFENTPAVTVSSYQTATAFIMKDFWLNYEGQTDEAGRLTFVSDTEEKLLALRVPADGRTVHFELASGLELLRQGLLGDAAKVTEGQNRLQQVFADNPWLTE